MRIDHSTAVIAGLVPATPMIVARPCLMIGVAGTSPAMTLNQRLHGAAENAYSAIAIAVGCQSMRTWPGCPAMRLSQARIAGKPVRSKSHSLAMCV
jgi:hypothetical protein